MEEPASAWALAREWAVVAAAIATAIFTGLMARISWRQHAGKIVSEWNLEYRTNLLVEVTIRNGLPFTIEPWRVKVSGPAINDVRPPRDKKHSSWGSQSAPIFDARGVSPSSSATSAFVVVLDWEQLHRQQQRWPARLRTWLAKVVWRSLSRRVHHGASLHFCITIASRSNSRWRKAITERIFISPAIIANKAAASTNQTDS